MNKKQIWKSLLGEKHLLGKPVHFSVEKYSVLLLYTSTVKTLLHSSNMQKQKLHHFCNRSSPDDGPKSGRKNIETMDNT